MQKIGHFGGVFPASLLANPEDSLCVM